MSTVEERRMYDWSLARSEKAERYIWPFEVDIMEPSREEPPPQVPFCYDEMLNGFVSVN